MELLLPSRIHTIRQVVDAAFQQASLQPRVIGEVESVLTLVSAVGADLGDGAAVVGGARDPRRAEPGGAPDREPDHPGQASSCTSDHQPLSEPAHAVHDLFHELIADFG